MDEGTNWRRRSQRSSRTWKWWLDRGKSVFSPQCCWSEEVGNGSDDWPNEETLLDNFLRNAPQQYCYTCQCIEAGSLRSKYTTSVTLQDSPTKSISIVPATDNHIFNLQSLVQGLHIVTMKQDWSSCSIWWLCGIWWHFSKGPLVSWQHSVIYVMIWVLFLNSLLEVTFFGDLPVLSNCRPW